MTRILRTTLLLLTLNILTAAALAQLTRQAATTVNLPLDLPGGTYSTVNALPINNTPNGLSFRSPIATTFPTGITDRIWVVERGNTVAPSTNQPRIQVVSGITGINPVQATFIDLGTWLAAQGRPALTDNENGLLAMAFHPQYNQNGWFYLYYSLTIDGQAHQRLARFQASGTAGNYNAAMSADPVTETPLLTMLDRIGNHNGGDLHFGPDGFLYLSLGDEGGGGDVYNNARFINKYFWGQLLRLDVDNNPANPAPHPHTQASTSHPSAVHAGAYRVPADNPFIGFTSWHGQTIDPASVRTEIFATGLRNPFRFSIDAPTGRIFLGDVGQGNFAAIPNISYEEVNLIVKGGDYGWSWREGKHDYFAATTPPPFPGTSPSDPRTPPATGFTPLDPIFEYDRENDGGATDSIIYGVSVCGGRIYRGALFPELFGSYLFSDIFGGAGIIAALRETTPGVWTGTRLTSRPQIVHFGIDPRDGELLLCSLSGSLFRLRRDTTTGPQLPALLSQTGVFSSLATLTPQPGVVPYQPNVDFWSDYAHKSRWFAMTNMTDTVGFSRDGNWTFPNGIVWVKHFDIETVRGNPATRRKLETRLLVKTATGAYGLSYRWRGDQTDADLVNANGLTEAIPGSTPAQSWRFPSRSECISCHTAAGGFALSFNTRQLSRPSGYGGPAQHQIEALSMAGYFSFPVNEWHSLPSYARADDTAASLEWRVRSYFAVNCSQCHQPGGPANGNWDARLSTPTDLAQLINGPLVNDGGDAANRFAVPGDTAHSMVLRRVQGLTAGRMPPLGTLERNLAAEQLLTDWITQSLPQRRSFAQWQALHFSSPSDPAAQPAADPDNDGQDNEFEFLAGTDPLAGDSLWTWQSVIPFGVIQFTQPADRAMQWEVSSDLQSWSAWNDPANAPYWPAAPMQRSLTIPSGAGRIYLRARFSGL